VGPFYSASPFTFQQLNVSDLNFPDHPNWALIPGYFVAGLTNTQTNYGKKLAISSAYRSPLVQHVKSPHFPHDRHIHGDAADLATGNDPAVWNELKAAALKAGACVEPLYLLKKYSKTPQDHVHGDWQPRCPNSAWRK
jgi:hypothetical protein